MLSIFMALQELGIATDIVTTAFAILFGAVAFGLALAFGLGNRELAGMVTREWYQRYRAEREAIEREVAARDLKEESALEMGDAPAQTEMLVPPKQRETATPMVSVRDS
jgi:hypothetical protein